LSHDDGVVFALSAECPRYRFTQRSIGGRTIPEPRLA
jgi:hypothetical protein